MVRGRDGDPGWCRVRPVRRRPPGRVLASVLQAVSILGALAVLGAFAADQFGWIDPGRLSYALANSVGAGILTAVAVIEAQVGFVVLQGAWTLISLWGAVVILRSRPGTG